MRAADNPFRSARIESLRYRGPGFRWEPLLARLSAQGGRGAIRGAQGSGKTTLLHELGDRLEDDGWEVRRLRPHLDDRREAGRQLRELPVGAGGRTALLLDGADRLGPLRWSRFVRSSVAAGVLVVTSHREGRLPTLHRCATDPALLVDLVGELLAGSDTDLDVSARRVERLFHRQGGDLRRAFRELYDACAAR